MIVLKHEHIEVCTPRVGRTTSYEISEEEGFSRMMDTSGFPELLEYTIKLADHNTVNLQLELDRSLKMPPSLIQKADGHMETKQAPNTV